jgi:hypothetical protein
VAIAGIIKEGATTVAATGGTDVTLQSLGIQGNKNTLTYSTDTSNLTRRLVEFSVKPYGESASAPGGYTQQRNTVLMKWPKVLANLSRTINTFKMESSVDPETTNAEIESMVESAAQLAGSSAFLAFWTTQNLN